MPEMDDRTVVVTGANSAANALFGQSPAQGALLMLYAATAPDIDGGGTSAPAE